MSDPLATATVLRQLIAASSPELRARLVSDSERALQTARELPHLHPDLVSEEDGRLEGAIGHELYALHAEIVKAVERETEAGFAFEFAEVKRHLPGLAGVLDLVWEHVAEESRSAAVMCCTGGPSLGWLVSDPRLASIFERIARALPSYSPPEGLTPYSLLESYAGLIEQQASISPR